MKEKVCLIKRRLKKVNKDQKTKCPFRAMCKMPNKNKCEYYK
jgi:hypothetical protein